MFNKIIFITKQGIDLEEGLINNIKKICGDRKIFFVKFDELKKEDFGSNDLVITFGGDGTFVKAANLINDSFLLGINSNPEESEGALTNLNLYEIDKIKEILNGDFDILKRHRVKVKLNGIFLEELALNEVYVGAFSQFHSSRYKIKFRGEEEEHRSSGIIVSTGTGSPAWFYSAGGEIFNHDEEKLSFIVREPYFGKRIFTPKILKGDLLKGEKLIIESKRNFGGLVAVNETTYDFNEGDIIEIELSDNPLKEVRLK
jgi:NAD kinase